MVTAEDIVSFLNLKKINKYLFIKLNCIQYKMFVFFSGMNKSSQTQQM